MQRSAQTFHFIATRGRWTRQTVGVVPRAQREESTNAAEEETT
jgi:hypothetical protein